MIESMPSAGASNLASRPYRPRDRAAIRDICAATASCGRPAPDCVGDEWIWAEFWTRYFTDREPRHTWVVEDPSRGRVVGYLTGTADARRAETYAPFLLPGVIWRVIRRRLLRRPVARRALRGLARSLLAGELDVPARMLRRYPATLHIDLLPPAQGCGLGRELFRVYVGAMRSLGVPGVHAQSLSVNHAVARFNERVGFRLVRTTPLHAFAHIDGHPIGVHTWLMTL